MISVEKALKIIKAQGCQVKLKKVPIKQALGTVLAEDLISPIDMPSFNQAAMDGYAFCFTEGMNHYEVIGEVAAGSLENPQLEIGQGVRIFTGAMVPSTANIVVQQELIKRNGNSAIITETVRVGKNIRIRGEQIKQGDIALRKGVKITPAAVGFLLGLGITEIIAYSSPKITLITTGNELVQPGEAILPGQIYESNSGMLASALDESGFGDYTILTVADNYEETKLTIKQAIVDSDMLMLTGGISVGDYDFVGKALKELAVEELFYKINQKPGKPIYLGRLGEVLIAALPGNPAAALTCFYIYVLPVLNNLKGDGFCGLEEQYLPMATSFNKKGNRAQFLKAVIKGDKVHVLEMQSSAMLRSFAESNAIIYIPENDGEIAENELVKVYKL